MKRVVTIILVVGLLGIVAFRLISNKKTIESKKKVKDTSHLTVSVNTVKAAQRLSTKRLSLVGTVTANQLIDIKSEVQGKVTRLYFELGSYVPQGKVIAQVDDKIRQLGVANAEQSLADAYQNFERYKNLYEGGGATKAQLDQYKLALENAENRLQQARKELSSASVIAPFSGYITAKSIEEGAFVNIGSPIATIVDVSELKVQLNVPEKDVYALRVGDAVDISTTVYPGISYKGKIKFIGFHGDEAHNYPVEVSIINQKENPLKSGTYVDVLFNKNSETATLQIPREALIGSVKDAKVYVIESDSIARLRKIVIGSDNDSYIEVLKGLQAGDQVVTSGQVNLNDSSRVSVINN